MPIHYSEGEFPLDIYSNAYTEQSAVAHGYNFSGCGCCQPYNINKAVTKLQNLYLVTNISAEAVYTLSITIDYADGTSKVYTLEKNKKYKVQYLSNGNLNTIIGVITNIGKINSSSNCTCDCCSTTDYIIRIDASSACSSLVEDIKISNIREIKPYIEHADEDSTILSAKINNASVLGVVHNVTITNAIVSADGIASAGTITQGTVDSEKGLIVDGCPTGVNSLNTTITTINSEITGGNIVSGVLKYCDLSDESKNNITVLSTASNGDNTNTVSFTAKALTLVATDCNIVGAKSINGTIIQPTIENSTVVGGKRTGSDMITTGATVIGDTAYGGCTTGGTLIGGTATGTIDGAPYIIENGTTTKGTSIKCTVTGGKIVGGKTVGNCTVGATVYGGIAECGSTTGGITIVSDSSDSYIKPGSTSLPAEITCTCPKVYLSSTTAIGDLITVIKTNNTTTS
jgi:hypothetical protein